jgi:DNA invertase Pin-like site-specific DNA recombinase
MLLRNFLTIFTAVFKRKDYMERIGAAYVRVSDERQDEYSPDSQLKKIRECAKKDGVTIPDEFVFYDDGISGRSVKKRNDLNRMIALAKEKEHPFEVIYVWKFSRFARNQEEAIVYKNLLKKKNVSVVSVSEPIPEGHFGTLIERIIEWMDEYYSINLSTEVQRGMVEKVSRGEPVASAPFGYKMGNKVLLIDEKAADIVREAFKRYANGEGTRRIATNLAGRGILTNKGNTPDYRWVDYILHNPVYIGKLRWSTDGKRPVNRRKFDDDSIMLVDGNHDPILSLELWEKVQARLKEEKQKYPKYAKKEQPVMVMSKGLIRCSSCGGTLAMATIGKSVKNKTPRFQCCNYNQGRCHTSHSIAVPRIESAILDGLRQAVDTQQFTISPERKTEVEKAVPDYAKLIATEGKKLERAKSAYLAEIDTLEEYKHNKAEIEQRIAELIEERDKGTPQETFDTSAFANKVIGVLEYLQDDKVSLEAKNEALRTIVDKVVYDKAAENVAIYFYEN